MKSTDGSICRKEEGELQREQSIKSEIKRAAEYALRSHRKNLLYEAYGSAKTAFELNAITKDEFYELNDLIVRHGLNNPEWCRKNYGGVPK